MLKLDHTPYIIAEIGVNHENSLETAIKMVHQIAEAGGHAVKFQAYKAGKLASKHSPAYWDQSEEPCDSQYQLFSKYDQFSLREYQVLEKECEKVKVDFLCTPFDKQAVDELVPMMPFVKVASADITNFPLLEDVAKHNKPVILSVGASTLSEVCYAVEFLKEQGIQDIALLHCVLSYPTKDADAQLNTISYLQSVFPDTIIGYSDHTKPTDMLIPFISFVNGAQIIEKHFTFDKALPGNDHYHAMDHVDLANLVEMIDRYKVSGGYYSKEVLPCEEAARKQARRGLVAKQTLRVGHEITMDDIEVKRPAHGLEPKDLYWLIGRKLNKEIDEDCFIHKEDLV